VIIHIYKLLCTRKFTQNRKEKNVHYKYVCSTTLTPPTIDKTQNTYIVYDQKNKKEGTRRTKGKDLIQNPITFSNKSGEKNKKKLHTKKIILNKLHWTTEDTNTRKVSKDIQQDVRQNFFPKHIE
jgi:hypothetical protein